jgi:hypothetical protein
MEFCNPRANYEPLESLEISEWSDGICFAEAAVSEDE